MRKRQADLKVMSPLELVKEDNVVDVDSPDGWVGLMSIDGE